MNLGRMQLDIARLEAAKLKPGGVGDTQEGVVSAGNSSDLRFVFCKEGKNWSTPKKRKSVDGHFDCYNGILWTAGNARAILRLQAASSVQREGKWNSRRLIARTK